MMLLLSVVGLLVWRQLLNLNKNKNNMIDQLTYVSFKKEHKLEITFSVEIVSSQEPSHNFSQTGKL